MNQKGSHWEVPFALGNLQSDENAAVEHSLQRCSLVADMRAWARLSSEMGLGSS